jgi:hypothetical protein
MCRVVFATGWYRWNRIVRPVMEIMTFHFVAWFRLHRDSVLLLAWSIIGTSRGYQYAERKSEWCSVDVCKLPRRWNLFMHVFQDIHHHVSTEPSIQLSSYESTFRRAATAWEFQEASESYHMVQCAIISEKRFSSTTANIEGILKILGHPYFTNNRRIFWVIAAWLFDY